MAETWDGQKHTTIRTPDHRLRVFISSTLKELADEREAVRQAVLQLHLLPVMFETGARPHPARDLYQAYLAQSHVFIGIYWQSYGWVGPGMSVSGLEDEYNLSADKPRLIYIKGPAPAREAGLEQMLARLQNENTVSYKRFSTAEELRELVENDLALLLTEMFETARETGVIEPTPRPLTNLPIPHNPLLGREQELATIWEWLARPEQGLVTLTGAGGTGKSRLAIEAALALRDQFADGVYLVQLTPVSEPQRVIPVIGETLHLHENAQGRSVDDLLPEFLRNRQMLLLLDNFEQVLAAAPRIADLLEKCPRLKILVTSRAPLRLRGEKELLVQPLAVPSLKEVADLQRLSQYAAVTLFIQRSQSLKPDFEMTAANAPAIAEICSRLDGLPLAIELAAAHTRLLRPQDLLARLGRRFDVLRGGTRDLPERQQTLRGAIAWSYNLLSDPVRTLFRRLSVFVGGCGLEAAEAVCNPHGDLGLDFLEAVESLADFSLLTPSQEAGGQQRLGMLESIREYAFERLVESGEAEQLHRQHAEYFLHFVQEVEPRIRTRERVRWREQMEQELDNIRAAVQWSIAGRDGAYLGPKILLSMRYFWVLCGHLSEARQHLRLVEYIDQDDAAPLAVRAGLAFSRGSMALLHGENDLAMPVLLESVRLARQAGDEPLLVSCLLWCGAVALTMTNLPLAADMLHEALTLSRALGDEWSQVLALLWLSNTAQLSGEPERAKKLFDESLALAYKQGDPWCLVAPLIDVAQESFADGNLEKARATLLKIESVLRLVGDQWTLSWVINGLGQVALAKGELDAARKYFVEGLSTARDYGNMIVLAFSLVETAVLITQRSNEDATQRASELNRAARLVGAATPFLDHPLLFSGEGLRQQFASMVDRVHAQIHDPSWEAAGAEGRSLPLDQALELAMQELSRA